MSPSCRDDMADWRRPSHLLTLTLAAVAVKERISGPYVNSPRGDRRREGSFPPGMHDGQYPRPPSGLHQILHSRESCMTVPWLCTDRVGWLSPDNNEDLVRLDRLGKVARLFGEVRDKV